MWLEERLKAQRERGEERRLPLLEGRRGHRVRRGREMVDLSSNDYLGLAQDRRLVDAAAAALDQWGVGSTGSRLMSGDLPPHRLLEERIARWKGADAALLLGSGYLANVGVISALAPALDLILLDRLCHASIIDGVLLSRVRFRRFRHNDMAHLEEELRGAGAGERVLVIVEGVYSMDGDVAPVAELLRLRRRYGFRLLLDDAHGVGALGRRGRGVVPRSWASEVDLQVGTFGKALGSYGAFVACSSTMRRYLLNSMRTFIFSTAPPPALAAASLAALDVAKAEGWRRRKLARLAAWFRRQVRERLGLGTPSRSHIVPVVVGGNRRAVEVAAALARAGFHCRAVRPPTVPAGSARIRFSLSASMEQRELEGVFDVLEGAIGGG